MQVFSVLVPIAAETVEEIHEGFGSVIVVVLFILAALGVLIWWLRR